MYLNINLTVYLRHDISYEQFKQQLKTYLFGN